MELIEQKCRQYKHDAKGFIHDEVYHMNPGTRSVLE